jgi:hypothetical protein
MSEVYPPKNAAFVRDDCLGRALVHLKEMEAGIEARLNGYVAGESTLLWNLGKLLLNLAAATEDDLLSWMLYKASDFVFDAREQCLGLHKGVV